MSSKTQQGIFSAARNDSSIPEKPCPWPGRALPPKSEAQEEYLTVKNIRRQSKSHHH
ncbi:hypothetical protein [Prevotella intermedia]|uniref:hypothetical protein n=1 Tax=Prevotella intermedia TaxID=28131 RepID=UPI0012FE8501|nr:hypothetical protein [Prevotella intermedia]